MRQSQVEAMIERKNYGKRQALSKNVGKAVSKDVMMIETSTGLFHKSWAKHTHHTHRFNSKYGQ